MNERNRTFLKQEFSDGERPSGADFADLMDSFLNKQDDGLTVEGGNLVLSRGLSLGDSDNNAAAGTLCFRGGKVKFHNGTTFVDLASAVFEPVGSGGAVFYGSGNVGIGAAFTAAPPTYRFEVDLGPNTAEADRVRFGNASVHNGSGSGLGTSAYFSHCSHSTDTNHALRQGLNGAVVVNAPGNRTLSLCQNGNQVRLQVLANTGRVVVLDEIRDSTAAFQVSGSLQITGDAQKPGGGAWIVPSDARLKEDVRGFELGLSHLLQVHPVRFRYNGKAGTPAGFAGVGVIGQEMEQVFPEMVQRVPTRLDGDSETIDLRIYDGSALPYVLVNAVKELAARVESLEHATARRLTNGDDDD